MRKILITGCIYGAGNIGDEAILQGLIEVFEGDNLGVCVAGQPEVYRQQGFTCFGLSIPQLIKGIIWSDEVVLGGATLHSDPFGKGYPVGFCCQVLVLCRIIGRRCRFVGIGASRLHTPAAQDLAQRYYPFAEHSYVRNEASKEAMIESCKLKDDQVTVFCDTAFLITKVNLEGGRKALSNSGIEVAPGRLLIGVSVVNEGFAAGRPYHKQIAAACDLLHQELGATIVFIYSEIREGEAYDIAAAERVKEEMKAPWVDLKPDFYDPLAFSGALAHFDAVIAMRMHVLIMGALSGVPVATVVREAKVNQILGQLGVEPAGTIDNVDGAALAGTVKKMIENKDSMKTDLIDKVAGIAKDAREVITVLRSPIDRHYKSDFAFLLKEGCRLILKKFGVIF